MNIEDLKQQTESELDCLKIELAYEMGKVDGKQEIIDRIKDIYKENGDE